MPIEQAPKALVSSDQLFEIREEFSHSSPRMAQAIKDLRAGLHSNNFHIDKLQAKIHDLNEDLRIKESEILQREKTIDEQSREIANNSEYCNGLKLEIAQSQANIKTLYTTIETQAAEIARLSTIVDDDAKARSDLHLALTSADISIAKFRDLLASASDELVKGANKIVEIQTERIKELTAHSEYLEKTANEARRYESILSSNESYRRTIRLLTDENIELHGKVDAKWILRRPVSIAHSIRDKLARRREYKTTA